MAILPYHHWLVEVKKVYSKSEMRWIASCQWLMIALSLFTLAWLVYNIVMILVKQRKCKVLPLVNFYVLSVILVVTRIVFLIYFFPASMHCWILAQLMPETIKLLLGIELTWINVELITTLRFSQRVIEEGAAAMPTKFLRFGRILTILLTTGLLLATTAFYSYVMETWHW